LQPRGRFPIAWSNNAPAFRANTCHGISVLLGRQTARRGKRVLVRCYHGLGDTILFSRYMPLLKSRAREVIVWAQPKLIPLLRFRQRDRRAVAAA
jgi:hypothetical protein